MTDDLKMLIKYCVKENGTEDGNKLKNELLKLGVDFMQLAPFKWTVFYESKAFMYDSFNNEFLAMGN